MAIFVFGSNQAGKHYGGAAFHALKECGAILGQGEGLQGESYALPTMDKNLRPLPLEEVAVHVAHFLRCAFENPDKDFHVTAVGCGIAGFKRKDIIPLFAEPPANCFFFESDFGQVIPGRTGTIV